MFYMLKKYIPLAVVSKHNSNRETKVIHLIISNGEEHHY